MNDMRVMCYDPSSDASGRVNKLVASVDGPFCHCELHFSDGYAFTIYMGGAAMLRSRRFSSPNYRIVEVRCTPEQQKHCREFAEDVVKVGVPFSKLRMMNAFLQMQWPGADSPASLVVPLSHKTHGSFCSELVTEALQTGGVLSRSVAAQYVTPSGLVRLLQQEAPRTVEGNPVPVCSVVPGHRTAALGFREGVAGL